MCSFQYNGTCFREHRVWIDYNNMTVALYCTNEENRSILVLTILLFWVCQQNVRLRQSTFLCPTSEFARHLACLSRHDPTVVLRQLHDNLHDLEYL